MCETPNCQLVALVFVYSQVPPQSLFMCNSPTCTKSLPLLWELVFQHDPTPFGGVPCLLDGVMTPGRSSDIDRASGVLLLESRSAGCEIQRFCF